MKALVLSGGGNRGAMQVGALQVLLEAGIVPDMVVGASVGAINGAGIAHDPTPRGAETLARLWREVKRDDLYPGNSLTAIWSMVSGKAGLFSNSNWYRFLHRHTPVTAFAGLQARCYIAATELDTGHIHIFGDDPNERLIDALMASCAMPPLHPPYMVNGKAYIDGGATANLPLRIALERGATEIYALNIWGGLPKSKARNFFDVSTRAVTAILQRQIYQDIEHCTSRQDVWVREIQLVHNDPLDPWDFSKTDELLEIGREAARVALAQGPLRPPAWHEKLNEAGERFLDSLAAATGNLGTMLWPKESVKQPAVVRSRASMGD